MGLPRSATKSLWPLVALTVISWIVELCGLLSLHRCKDVNPKASLTDSLHARSNIGMHEAAVHGSMGFCAGLVEVMSTGIGTALHSCPMPLTAARSCGTCKFFSYVMKLTRNSKFHNYSAQWCSRSKLS